MTQHNAIKLFETKKVRTIWDDKEEKMVLFHSGCGGCPNR